MKKKTIMITLLTTLLTVSVLTGCSSDNSSLTMPFLNIPMAGNEVPNIEYFVEIENTRSFPSKANVYRFDENLPDAETEVQNLSILFGISQETTVSQKNDDFIIVDDGEHMIDYEKATGTWLFVDHTYDKQKMHLLPSDNDSVEIARKYLTENGLYNDRFLIETVVPQYAGSELDSTYAPYCKAVYFYPQVDGLSVLGVSRIVVKVGEDGQIIGVMKNYKDFALAGQIDLASPLSFIDGIKSNLYSSSINETAVSARIYDVKLGYWEDAGSHHEQPYLQPVWIFMGEADLPDGATEGFDVIVQAAEKVDSSALTFNN